MSKKVLSLNNLSVSFNHKTIISALSYSFKENHTYAILGRSGTGKSCLLKAICQILPDEATVLGEISSTYQPLAHHLSYMPQHHGLLPWLNVIENCLLSNKLNGKPNSTHDISRARHLLDSAGLGRALNLYPHQLSGGMQQRLALARTLIQGKPIILMDEPFSSLDAITRREIHDLAKKLLQNKTVIMVTHDPEEALYLANDILIMKDKTLKIFDRNLSGTTKQSHALIEELATQEVAA